MADKQQLLHLQNKIVHCLAQSLSQPWDYFVINFERVGTVEDWKQDSLSLSFAKEKSGSWKQNNMLAPYECCALLRELSELMMSPDGTTWGSCTLEFDSSGKYHYSFSYEPPKRLNGNFDDEAQFNHYTPRPL